MQTIQGSVSDHLWLYYKKAQYNSPKSWDEWKITHFAEMAVGHLCLYMMDIIGGGSVTCKSILCTVVCVVTWHFYLKYCANGRLLGKTWGCRYANAHTSYVWRLWLSLNTTLIRGEEKDKLSSTSLQPTQKQAFCHEQLTVSEWHLANVARLRRHC